MKPIGTLMTESLDAGRLQRNRGQAVGNVRYTANSPPKPAEIANLGSLAAQRWASRWAGSVGPRAGSRSRLSRLRGTFDLPIAMGADGLSRDQRLERRSTNVPRGHWLALLMFGPMACQDHSVTRRTTTWGEVAQQSQEDHDRAERRRDFEERWAEQVRNRELAEVYRQSHRRDCGRLGIRMQEESPVERAVYVLLSTIRHLSSDTYDCRDVGGCSAGVISVGMMNERYVNVGLSDPDCLNVRNDIVNVCRFVDYRAQLAAQFGEDNFGHSPTDMARYEETINAACRAHP